MKPDSADNERAARRSTMIAGSVSRAADAIEASRDWVLRLVVLVGLFIGFYLAELSDFTLSIDEERRATTPLPLAWLSQGRWTAAIMDFIIVQPILPYFTLLFFGICCAASYVMVLSAFGRSLSDRSYYLLFLLYCAFPTLFFNLDFALNTPPVAIGFLSTGAAIFLFSRMINAIPAGGRAAIATSAALQVILIAIAIGAYQSFVLVILFGYVSVFAHFFSRNPEWGLSRAVIANLAALIVVGAGALASFQIGKLLQLHYGLSSGYIDAFFRPDVMIQNPEAVFRRVARSYFETYFGHRHIYIYQYYSMPIFIAFGYWCFFHNSRRSRAENAALAAYVFAATTIPFLLHPLSAGESALSDVARHPVGVLVLRGGRGRLQPSRTTLGSAGALRTDCPAIALHLFSPAGREKADLSA